MTDLERKNYILGLDDSHPAKIAYLAGNDTLCKQELDKIKTRGPVPINELSAFCIKYGVVGACEAAAWHSESPIQLKALCFTVLSLVRDDYRLETADVDDPNFVGACDLLVSNRLMAPEVKAGIIALGDNRVQVANFSVEEIGLSRQV